MLLTEPPFIFRALHDLQFNNWAIDLPNLPKKIKKKAHLKFTYLTSVFFLHILLRWVSVKEKERNIVVWTENWVFIKHRSMYIFKIDMLCCILFAFFLFWFRFHSFGFGVMHWCSFWIPLGFYLFAHCRVWHWLQRICQKYSLVKEQRCFYLCNPFVLQIITRTRAKLKLVMVILVVFKYIYLIFALSLSQKK